MTTVVQQSAPIVRTSQGAVRGSREGGVCVFRGIPYAQPPVGERRFRPPVPPEPWDGVRDVARFGASHIQRYDPVEGPLMHDSTRQPAGDDCLNLNVWTPDPASGGLPVLVWLHGGGLNTGAGSDELYDGATFARDGVVTVTLNYRLHPAGYLYVPGRPGAGAFGLLDQIAALEWVRDTIAAFGGDPDRVTVAGESAGAHSVGALLAAPGARGLFRRAILQSGAASFDVSAEVAAVHGVEVLRRLGVDPADEAALAAVDGATLLATSTEAERDNLDRLTARGLRPGLMSLATRVTSLITSGGDVLPRRPLAAVADGAAAGVDLLIGTTLDEAALFPPAFNAVAPTVAEAAFGGPEFPAPYRAQADPVLRFVTDTLFRIPAIRLAEAALPHHPQVFMFLLGWGSPPVDRGRGAMHGLDLPFMWNRIDTIADVIFEMAGRAPSPAFAEAMHGAWVRFVTDGTPGHPALPEWPTYDTTRRSTMWLDEQSRVVDDPMADERRAWHGVAF
jgi:para-nitrobenzyl esterase